MWQGEICKRCNRRNCVGFEVDPEIWTRVTQSRWNVLCTTCFDELAEQQGVVYVYLGVWPVTWSQWGGHSLMSRYLEPAEKVRELEAWSANTGADEGARVHVDRLNRIEGVCTVQSCIGHVAETTSGQHVQSGTIEMRLSSAALLRFYAAMPEIAKLEGFEDVSIRWRPGQEICCVSFLPGGLSRFVDKLVEVLTPACEASASLEVAC